MDLYSWLEGEKARTSLRKGSCQQSSDRPSPPQQKAGVLQQNFLSLYYKKEAESMRLNSINFGTVVDGTSASHLMWHLCVFRREDASSRHTSLCRATMISLSVWRKFCLLPISRTNICSWRIGCILSFRWVGDHFTAGWKTPAKSMMNFKTLGGISFVIVKWCNHARPCTHLSALYFKALPNKIWHERESKSQMLPQAFHFRDNEPFLEKDAPNNHDL